ncbi:MAG: asparagine--tRNA ligase [bacterium]
MNTTNIILDTEKIRIEGEKYEGKEITLQGWVWNKRSSGKIKFLILRDGKGFIQCVIDNPSLFEVFDECTQETSCQITGILKKDPRSPIGFEVLTTNINIIHKAENYPITPKEHGIDFLMDHRHLWIRSRKQFAILRIRNATKKYIREFLEAEGFIEFDSPIFTPSACEGTTSLFEVDYFGEKIYLSQSGQLYQEAGALSFGKVYCFGPNFRAERSKTRRHLIEFWMVEPEIAFADLNYIIDLAENMITYVIQQILKNHTYELKILERNLESLEKVTPPFYRITYKEAVNLLKEKGIDFKYGEDFGAPEETAISENFDKPVIITHYPKKIKPFYMKINPQDPETVLNMDIIAPEGYGEIVGGSQREDNYETLFERMKEENIPLEDYQWYLDLRKYGSVPHSGFGLGIERFVSWICKLDHVREAIPFPRMLYRYRP